MKKKSEKFSICTFCLSKMFKVWGFGLCIDYYQFKFQNSFYTWVTFSKMSNWNIKPHELLRKKMYKAKQSQD